MIPLEVQEQNRLLCKLLKEEFADYDLTRREGNALWGLCQASFGDGQDRVALSFPRLQQVCRSMAKDLRDVIALLIDAEVVLAKWEWLPQGVQSWVYQVDPNPAKWERAYDDLGARKNHCLRRLMDRTFAELPAGVPECTTRKVSLASWDCVMASVREFNGWSQPESVLVSELPSLSGVVARVVAANGFSRLAGVVASGTEWKAQASRSGSVCIAVGAVGVHAGQETDLDAQPRRGAQINPEPCAVVAPMLPSAYAGLGKPAIRVPEEVPPRQDVPARKSGGGEPEVRAPESRAPHPKVGRGENAKETDPPESRAGGLYSSKELRSIALIRAMERRDEESHGHGLDTEAVLSARDFWVALKERLQDLKGVAGASWSDGHKKELLECARVGAGGSFKHRRGDFYNFWRAVIFGGKDGAPGRPDAGTGLPKACVEVLLSAASYGLQQRFGPGPWFIGNAAKVWWRKVTEREEA